LMNSHWSRLGWLVGLINQQVATILTLGWTGSVWQDWLVHFCTLRIRSDHITIDKNTNISQMNAHISSTNPQNLTSPRMNPPSRGRKLWKTLRWSGAPVPGTQQVESPRWAMNEI
jgi:hypothetical protein